jgi:hypothetical protein
MRTLSGEVSALKEQIAAVLRERVAEQLLTQFDDLRKEVLALKTQTAGLPPPPVPSVPNVPPPAPVPPSPQPPVPSAPSLDSRIISDFPAIFAEFRKFSLLWRGSRDGFTKEEFHRRCNGHANTLTVILDTKGNIFGGFTPVEWESGLKWKADDSLQSFLFTLKNPHNIPARRFALKAERKREAISCNSGRGPFFGGDIGVYDNCNANARSFTRFGECDISVAGNCNANANSYTFLGASYTNDTGLDEFVVFTGSDCFQVKEIEVFEITD